MILETKHIFSFYYSPNNKDIFTIDNKDPLYNRIAIILRMKKDDIYICFDTNFIYTVVIIEINKKSILNKIIEKKYNEKSIKKVTAYIPYLEREYLNEAFYIMGQQGITNIFLIKTALSQIKAYTEKDYIRFEKLMIQGCEQGKQYVLPIFNKISISIEELVNKKEKIYWFYEQGKSLTSFFIDIKEQQSEYSFLCGPERGFSDEEINILIHMKDYQSIQLSSSILRSVDVIHFASIFFQSI